MNTAPAQTPAGLVGGAASFAPKSAAPLSVAPFVMGGASNR
jgi:hypothetical protein